MMAPPMRSPARSEKNAGGLRQQWLVELHQRAHLEVALPVGNIRCNAPDDLIDARVERVVAIGVSHNQAAVVARDRGGQLKLHFRELAG